MKKKLKLFLDKAVVEKAKIHSYQTGKSLSSMIEMFFEKLTENTISDRISRIAGKIEILGDFYYKDELRKGLEEKLLK
ncbi:hypothetical protein SAMN03080617_00308 [Algoriphagus alkaliphilus]|uniref:Uncharacterized protein n=1 Tax=Algoriphagus alkaliphilus TaxID=279824 RepID=A0A1G5V4U0_9BACT|nr:DUF6364 family protein [Algoriphagus alkaliphilus]SDA40287.1 hypothetical protein SAMN03080617_00308 [Algoriphagus alkaliphilus]